MTELVQKVYQAAELEERQAELLQEKKRLEKEVFGLHISAHNKQLFAEEMERSIFKKLVLRMTGTYEKRLDEACRDARAAKSQHSFSAARLENVNLQLVQIRQTLSEIQGCTYALSAALQEKLGRNPCIEEESLAKALEAAIKSGLSLAEAGKSLQNALDAAQSWIGTRPGMYTYIKEMQQAEIQAQEQFNTYTDLLDSLQQQLIPLGYSLEIQEIQSFGRDYLTGLLTGFMTSNRYLTVQIQLVQIDRQWNNLVPHLNDRLCQARIAWMHALCRVYKA